MSYADIFEAIKSGWYVGIGAGPHWREGGEFHAVARKGDCFIEGGAGDVEALAAKLVADMNRAVENKVVSHD